jgi:putative peptidoglycan lipid II flippase
MSLLKSAAAVGGLTLVSRALGFVRDILTASVVGTGPVAQAFVIAFRFPNLFRTAVCGRSIQLGFRADVRAATRRRGRAGCPGTSQRTSMRSCSSGLLGFTAAAQIAMPLLMYVIAPGFAGDPEKFDLSVALTRIAFPYLLFMSLTALQGGILNSLRASPPPPRRRSYSTS